MVYYKNSILLVVLLLVRIVHMRNLSCVMLGFLLSVSTAMVGDDPKLTQTTPVPQEKTDIQVHFTLSEAPRHFQIPYGRLYL
jgi:hypothetical protein